ncbi:MAG: PucR family transcriptional regulator [Mycobacteriaceae bacterium]|uniref:PucR family transcriptional regulator n=1 Tax=Corynebacterium variabile TaxID=1727 RepID=UPI003F8E7B29
MVSTEDGPRGGEWGELLDRLEADVGDMSEQIADEIMTVIPGYDHATRAKIVNTAQQNLSMSIRIIVRGKEPHADDITHARETALIRIEEGVPLGSLLRGFRMSMRLIQRRLLILAEDYGTPAEQLLEWSNLLWSLGDVFSSIVTGVYRDHEITRAVADSTRRSEWIGRMITGELDDAEIMRGAALYKVPTEGSFRIVLAPFRDGSGVEVEVALQRWAEAGGARLVTTVQSRSVAGVLISGSGDPGSPVGDNEARDKLLPAGIPVGLGRSAPLTELHRTFATVGRVVQSALDLGLTGRVDQEMLSWRMAINASPETTDVLRQRYLVPLRDSRAFGEDLIDSVRAFLDHRLNAREAAESIPVHVNTLRYRLRRFEELTGCDLGDVNTLVEVAWITAVPAGDGTA